MAATLLVLPKAKVRMTLCCCLQFGYFSMVLPKQAINIPVARKKIQGLSFNNKAVPDCETFATQQAADMGVGRSQRPKVGALTQ